MGESKQRLAALRLGPSLLGLLLCYFTGVELAEIEKFSAPESVNYGEMANFHCCFDIIESSMGVFWKVRGDVYLGPDVNPSIVESRQRYTIETDRDSGESNLTIVNAESGDSGNYSCYLVEGNHIVAQSEIVSFQVISQAPEAGNPKCYSSVEVAVIHTEGDEASISCMSTGGIPASSLRWEIDGSSLDNPEYSAEDSTAYSNYTWSLKPEHDGSTFTCFESHIDLPEDRMCSLDPLQVQHMPVVSTAMTINGDVPGSGSITFTCEVTSANPADVSAFTWLYMGYNALVDLPDQFEASDSTASTVEMVDITDEDLGQSLVCEVSNTVGSRTKDFFLPTEPDSSSSSTVLGGTLEIIIVVVVAAAVFFLICILIAVFTTMCNKKDDSDRQDKYSVNLDDDELRQGHVEMAADAYAHAQPGHQYERTIHQQQPDLQSPPPAAAHPADGGTVNASFHSDSEGNSLPPPADVEALYAKPSKKSNNSLSMGSNEDNTQNAAVENLYAQSTKRVPSTQSAGGEPAGGTNVLY